MAELETIETALEAYMAETGRARIDPLTVPTNDFRSESLQPAARVLAGFLKERISAYCYTWDSSGKAEQHNRAPCTVPADEVPMEEVPAEEVLAKPEVVVAR